MLPRLSDSAAAVAGGGLSCFFGYRLFKVVLAVFGFIIGALAASSVFGASDTTPMVIAAIVGGLAGAALLLAAYFVGVALVGAGIGALRRQHDLDADRGRPASRGRDPVLGGRRACWRRGCSATSSSSAPRLAGRGRSRRRLAVMGDSGPEGGGGRRRVGGLSDESGARSGVGAWLAWRWAWSARGADVRDGRAARADRQAEQEEGREEVSRVWLTVPGVRCRCPVRVRRRCLPHVAICFTIDVLRRRRLAVPCTFPPYSSVAQWQSIRLLTGGLLVRVQPEEPIKSIVCDDKLQALAVHCAHFCAHPLRN